MPKSNRLSLREILIRQGCDESEVTKEIFRNIYPRRLRWWWKFCMFCSRQKCTPETEFINGLANASSQHEVDDLHYGYRNSLRSERTFLMKPNRQRVRTYFKEMMRSVRNHSS